MVQRLAVALEALTQEPLAHGAQLPESTVAADIIHRSPGLEASNAYPIHSKIHDVLGTFSEQPSPPERSSERKPPFGGLEARLEGPDLENADRRVEAMRDDPKR